MTFVACGDDTTDGGPAVDASADGTTTDLDGAQTTDDGGVVGLDGQGPDGTSATCVPNGTGCVDDAGISQNGSCCTSLGPGHVCAEQNISDFSSTCAPSPCAGDPTGTWHVVSGCGTAQCATPGRGSAIGTRTIKLESSSDVGNAYSYSGNVGSQVKACGRTESSPGLIGGSIAPNPGTIGNLAYRVVGADLWIFPGKPSSDVAALKLAR